jgi:hypothetical protein
MQEARIVDYERRMLKKPEYRNTTADGKEMLFCSSVYIEIYSLSKTLR